MSLNLNFSIQMKQTWSFHLLHMFVSLSRHVKMRKMWQYVITEKNSLILIYFNRYAQLLRETRAATIIQKSWRGYHTRKNFNRVQKAVLKIQVLFKKSWKQNAMERLFEKKSGSFFKTCFLFLSLVFDCFTLLHPW